MVKHTQAIRRQQPTNCLSVFDQKLTLEGLTEFKQIKLFSPMVSGRIEVKYIIKFNSIILEGKFGDKP